MRPRRTPKSARGLTLVELLFVMAMAGVMLVAVVNFIGRTRSGLMKQEGRSELGRRGSLISSNLRSGLRSSVLLLTRGDFPGLQAIVEASLNGLSAPARVAFSQLPAIHNAVVPPLNTSAGADWGNQLFFISALQPVSVTVCYGICNGSQTSATALTVNIGRFQFGAYYLSQDRAARLPSLPGGGLRLVEWRSTPYINYADLNAYSGTPLLSHTVKALTTLGYSTAFKLNSANDSNAAFYTLQGTSPWDLTGPSPPPAFFPTYAWAYLDDFDDVLEINPKPNTNRGRVIRSGGQGLIAGPASYMVALNTSPTTSASLNLNAVLGPGKRLDVPAFATPNLWGDGYPGGFEVGIFGQPNGREVVLRTVLISVSGADPRGQPKTWPGLETLTYVSITNNGF